MKPQPQKLPYGHPSTLRDAEGGHKCKGFNRAFEHSNMELTPEQKQWLESALKSQPWM